MQGTVPTKGNLMAAEKQLATARLGNDLMERKKTILQAEAAKREELCRALEAEVAAAFRRAYDLLLKAQMNIGSAARFASAVPVDDGFSFTEERATGAVLPVVTVKTAASAFPPYGFTGTSEALDEAAEAFEKAKALGVRLACERAAFTAIREALAKTGKRANALANIRIPALEETVRFIAASLDEKEREEFSRLKRIKNG